MHSEQAHLWPPSVVSPGSAGPGLVTTEGVKQISLGKKRFLNSLSFHLLELRKHSEGQVLRSDLPPDSSQS